MFNLPHLDAFPAVGPRAGDVLNERSTQLLIEQCVHRPLRHETIIIPLDTQHRAFTILCIADTTYPDAEVEVVDFFSPISAEHNPHLVVATVRPAANVDGRDIDRWLEMSEIAYRAGTELLEWWVVSERGFWSPRDQLGETPRW